MLRIASRRSIATRGIALFLSLLAASAFLLTGCSEQGGNVLGPDGDTGEKNLHNPVHTATLVQSIGTKCTTVPSSSPWPQRDYSYIVTPAQGGLNRVVVGIGTTVFNPQNIILPTGWTFTAVNNTTLPHKNSWTPCGSIAVANQSTDITVHFSGPTMTTQFQIAYDSELEPHTVSWGASDGTRSSWAKRVGLGLGPVHAPGGGLTEGYDGPGDIVPKP